MKSRLKLITDRVEPDYPCIRVYTHNNPLLKDVVVIFSSINDATVIHTPSSNLKHVIGRKLNANIKNTSWKELPKGTQITITV